MSSREAAQSRLDAEQNPLFALLRRCVVRIDDGTGSFRGTGFFVAPGLVLTCAHVVHGADGPQVRWQDNAALAKVVDAAPQLGSVSTPADYPLPDLAVLEVERTREWHHPCVALANESPVLGMSPDVLYLAGYTVEHGVSPALTGVTTEFESPVIEDGHEFYKLKHGQVVGGFSGSPLLNIRVGLVAGIIESSRGRHANLGGFAVPVAQLAVLFPGVFEANRRYHASDSRWRTAVRAERFLAAKRERRWERLSPGPADQGEVEVYLATLIRWLNTDPWPQDTRFAGPTLTPAAIERKLRVASGRSHGEQDLDADELARRCTRLVVLGGPGSGKTWLARRTARLCAEKALEQLAAGAELDEVELPLYTTCARLSAAPYVDGIRRAIVSSALGLLPDLGGSQVLDALRVLFEVRSAPTLLVADSLDESHGADDRIRQADTLPPGWRIMLTSRPASFSRQLAIGESDPARRVGTLLPLRYPSDVEPFIAAWFTDRPLWAADLTVQLRNRPALRRAATVPLILAFYCIVGADQPLPGRRAKLYAKVIRRMLTGRWHGSSSGDPDADECMETLRSWAWSAAASNPVSGVGAWVDEFPTHRVRRGSQDDQDALDHVAVLLGPPDIDTGMARRRFVHRSLLEHLVAEHIALRMPAGEADDVLLNHMWYDPDWEYAAPAALAMHPQRDQVLKGLIRRITGAEEFPADLAPIDGCWEIRRFLAQVAQESDEADWSAEAAEIIGQARLDLATSGSGNLRQVVTDNWPTSSRLILEPVLGLLARKAYRFRAAELADAVTRLAATAEDRERAREALLAQLAREAEPWRARQLADAVAGLDPTAEDRERAREALLARLAREAGPEWARLLADAVAGLAVTVEDRERTREALLARLARETRPWRARLLADAVAGLDPTAEDRERAREALLARLAREAEPWRARQLADAVIGLAVTVEDRAQTRAGLLRLLSREYDPGKAQQLTDAVCEFAVSPEDRKWTREELLGLLDRITEPAVAAESWPLDREALFALFRGEASPGRAIRVADALTGLDPTAEDRTRARQALLGLLAAEGDAGRARQLTDALTRLDPTAEDRTRAREALLRLLDREDSSGVAKDLTDGVTCLDPTVKDRVRARKALLGLLTAEGDADRARQLTDALTRLDPTAEDRTRARQALLGLLAAEGDAGRARQLTDALTRLDPTAEDRTRAREALLRLLDREDSSGAAKDLTDGVTRLDPTVKDRVRARKALLRLLDRADDPSRIRQLAGVLTRLAVTAEDRAQTREALLRLLDHEDSSGVAKELVDVVIGLVPTAENWAQTREALLRLLDHEDSSGAAKNLAAAVSELDPTAEDKALIREVLLRHLIRERHPIMAWHLTSTLIGLNPTAEDRARAREALLRLLDRETRPIRAGHLANALTRLDPTAEDRARALDAVLRLLGHEPHPSTVGQLTGTVTLLAVTAEEQARTREALLRLLDHEPHPSTVGQLTGTVTLLAVTAEEQARTREALLGLLEREGSSEVAEDLADALTRLEPTAEDRTRAREALFCLLTNEDYPDGAWRLVGSVNRFTVTAEERAHTREVLLGLLEREGGSWVAGELADAVGGLDPTAEDRARARKALFAMLAHEDNPAGAQQLADICAKLSPTAADLVDSSTWQFPPTSTLLAAARQNSELYTWVAALPSITGVARTAAEIGSSPATRNKG